MLIWLSKLNSKTRQKRNNVHVGRKNKKWCPYRTQALTELFDEYEHIVNHTIWPSQSPELNSAEH